MRKKYYKDLHKIYIKQYLIYVAAFYWVIHWGQILPLAFYSFARPIGIHSNDTHKIEVTSPGQANALFIYAIKQGANINTSISINSNTVDYTNFQKLLTSNAGN